MAEEGCISFSAVMSLVEWVSSDVPVITYVMRLKGKR